MEADFWHERWEANRIAFHEDQANALLVKYFQELGLKSGARVFVPLCGKTRDIGYLLSHGCRVVGAELSEIAVRQLFEDLGISPDIAQTGNLKRYSGPDLVVYAGDIFDLSGDVLGPVDAVYDRAALVALPEEMRGRYVEHVAGITDQATQLIITFTYDQSQMDGPPFAIPEHEFHAHFAHRFSVKKLYSVKVEGRLKGKVDALEHIWLLAAEE